MPDLIVLGTAASVPDAEHDTIGLVLRGPDWAVPVDCGGSPVHKLARHGVRPDHIRAVILTHCHADHLYGLPMLVQGLWLNGRKDPLPLYGPRETLAVAHRLLTLFQLTRQPGMFVLEWRSVPLVPGCRVLDIEGVRITATPTVHADVQTIALRFDCVATGRSIVYSSDTEPCPALVRLATGADLLLHEATGNYRGHSSPAGAAAVARQAGAARLVLIHYPVQGVDLDRWRLAANEFPGEVALASDGDLFSL